MHTYELNKRRARKGFGERKKFLISEHKMCRSMIDHHTIMCYDREDSHELTYAKLRMAVVEKELLEITK